MNEDFLEILYRGDGSELNFAVFHYEELDQWWVGYFDYENQGWVEPITGKHKHEEIARTILKQKIQETRHKYFEEKTTTDYVYDKTVVFDITNGLKNDE